MARKRVGEVSPEKEYERLHPDAGEPAAAEASDEDLDKAQRSQNAAVKKKRAAAMEVLNNARRTRSRSGNWQA